MESEDDERPASIQGLSVVGAWASRAVDDRAQWARQCHDDVLAHDGRVRAAAGRLCRQPADYSFAALRATKECVIAIPAVEMASKVVKLAIALAAMSISSNCSV